MSPGNKAIGKMMKAYRDANNLDEKWQERVDHTLAIDDARQRAIDNIDEQLKKQSDIIDHLLDADCPDCYDDRNWKGKNPNCNHMPLAKIEGQELVHTGGYRDNALAVKVEPAKPIVWYRRWYQIWRAKNSFDNRHGLTAFEAISGAFLIFVAMAIGYLFGRMRMH